MFLLGATRPFPSWKDGTLIRGLTRQILESHAHSVLEVAGGDEALNIARNSSLSDSRDAHLMSRCHACDRTFATGGWDAGGSLTGRPAGLMPILGEARANGPVAPGHRKRSVELTTPSNRLRNLEQKIARLRGTARRADLTLSAAKAALEAGQLARAETYARGALEGADPKRRGEYGNIVHVANLVIGCAALARGDVAEARRRLLASAKTPGSTHLRTIGPNMALASELLERGERHVVLEYFRRCRRLWSDTRKLTEWEGIVRKGQVPDFGHHLDHGLYDIKAPQTVDTLKKLARLHWAMKQRDRAREFALEALRGAEAVRHHWNYGNVVHQAHLVLGHVALDQGRLDEAVHHLLAAGRTPGSPQLRNVGPHMSLAKRLLDRGRRFAVLEYLRLCGRFWKDTGRLGEWDKIVRAGGVPDFGNLLMEGRL